MYSKFIVKVFDILFSPDPSPPVVNIIFSNSTVIAGQLLTLTCSATVQEGIRGTPTLTWSREGFDDLPIETTSSPPLLTFPSLHTSHGGQYTCTARLNIPDAGVAVSGSNTTNVSVQSMLYQIFLIGQFSSFTSLCSSSTISYHPWLSKKHELPSWSCRNIYLRCYGSHCCGYPSDGAGKLGEKWNSTTR